ncbi:hypothetical protein FRC18_004834, partial [Serendipita sp. 400]
MALKNRHFPRKAKFYMVFVVVDAPNSEGSTSCYTTDSAPKGYTALQSFIVGVASCSSTTLYDWSSHASTSFNVLSHRLVYILLLPIGNIQFGPADIPVQTIIARSRHLDATTPDDNQGDDDGVDGDGGDRYYDRGAEP